MTPHTINFTLYVLSLVLGAAFLAGCCLLRDTAGLEHHERGDR